MCKTLNLLLLKANSWYFQLSVFFCVEIRAAVLVSFSNGLTQPVRIGDAIDPDDSSVVQILPDGEVGAIALAG